MDRAQNAEVFSMFFDGNLRGLGPAQCHPPRNKALLRDHVMLGGSSQDLQVVNTHGDRKSPKDRVVGPLPNGLYKSLINRDDSNYSPSMRQITIPFLPSIKGLLTIIVSFQNPLRPLFLLAFWVALGWHYPDLEDHPS